MAMKRPSARRSTSRAASAAAHGAATEDLLRDIAAGVSATVGEDFLRSLVLYLAKTLGAELAFVGKLTGDGREVETLSICYRGRIIENLRYPLAATPCEKVVRGEGPGIYPCDVQQLFPEDRPSAEMNLHSYAGTALRSSTGKVFGLLAVMDTRPLKDTRLARQLLEIFAARAAAELERERAERSLRESEQILRLVLDNLPVGVWVADRDGKLIASNPEGRRIWGGARYVGIEDYGLYKGWWADTGKPIAAHEWGMARAIQKGETSLQEVIDIESFDGTRKTILHSAVPIRADGGEVTGAIIVNQDITERKRAEDNLLAIARGVSATTGESFFHSLVAHLARMLQADHAFIGELIKGESDCIRTVAVYANGEQAENFEYLLSGTPCQNVVGWQTRVYSGAVAPQFPDDQLLADMGIEAYVGTPLFGAGGQALGLLVVMYERPIHDEKSVTSTLEIFAARAAAELERVRAEQALRESESRFRKFFEVAFEGIAIHEKGTILDANETLARMFGYALSEFIGRNALEFTAPESHEVVKQHVLAGYELPYEAVGLRKDGTTFSTEIVGRPIEYRGRPARTVAIRDITERKQAEDMLRRFGRILEASSNEIYVFDAETLKFVQVNLGAQQNLGYSMEELRGLTPLDLKPEHTPESFAQLVAPLRDGSQDLIGFETVHRRKDGSLYPVEVRLQLSRSETPPVFVAIIQDITERLETRERLQHLAYHDVLTDLANRVLLTDRLEHALKRAQWTMRPLAVLFLDLDRFKIINDTLGHDVGDRLLQVLAGRLVRCVREGDTVARVSGDEFAILLEDMASTEDVVIVARKLLETFTQPFDVFGRELFVTTSIGIAIHPGDGRDAATLLKNADTAMYRAKESGRNTYQFYSADMSARAVERLTLETGLRRALERREFVLHYQPQIDMASGRIVGAEALLRWRHAELGLLHPDDFIQLLEDTGLIVPVGEWVLEAACRQAAAWRNGRARLLRLSVNLSARQFGAANVVDKVRAALRVAALEPEALELEITETMLMEHREATQEVLVALGGLGVRFAVDDFGTGYSSLSYLKRFAIHTLKIDRSFVRDIPGDANDASIVQTIVAMAHNLKLGVVAEGVERDDQLAFLRASGCDAYQGFHYARPLAPAQFEALLARGAVSS